MQKITIFSMSALYARNWGWFAIDPYILCFETAAEGGLSP